MEYDSYEQVTHRSVALPAKDSEWTYACITGYPSVRETVHITLYLMIYIPSLVRLSYILTGSWK